jgi:hypothetical protein
VTITADPGTPVQRVIDRLFTVTGRHPRKHGRAWAAHCPAHQDPTPSLEVSEGTDQPVVLHCFAGCRTEDILKALGLRWTEVCKPTKRTGQTRKRGRVSRPPAGPEARHGARVPACIVEEADATCVAIYAYLDLRCGKENKEQRGLERIAEALGIDVRTLTAHLLHLAERGWVTMTATTTTNGARKATRVAVAHNPMRHRLADCEVFAPDRDHAKKRRRDGSVQQRMRDERPKTTASRTVAQPMRDAPTEPRDNGCMPGLRARPAANAPLSRDVERRVTEPSLDDELLSGVGDDGPVRCAVCKGPPHPTLNHKTEPEQFIDGIWTAVKSGATTVLEKPDLPSPMDRVEVWAPPDDAPPPTNEDIERWEAPERTPAGEQSW